MVRIVLDTMFIEEKDVLLFECPCLMVSFLISDVSNDFPNLGLRDTETAVTFLPVECLRSFQLTLCPLRRGTFDILNMSRHRNRRAKPGEDMDMVHHSADCDADTSSLADDTADITIEWFLSLRGDEGFTILCTEDNVVKEMGMTTHDGSFLVYIYNNGSGVRERTEGDAQRGRTRGRGDAQRGRTGLKP
jgi:hypothetical protein